MATSRAQPSQAARHVQRAARRVVRRWLAPGRMSSTVARRLLQLVGQPPEADTLAHPSGREDLIETIARRLCQLVLTQAGRLGGAGPDGTVPKQWLETMLRSSA